jgi:hypothetical protein
MAGEERGGGEVSVPISRLVAHIDVGHIGTTHTDVHVKCADRRSRRHAHRQRKGERGGENGGRGDLLEPEGGGERVRHTRRHRRGTRGGIHSVRMSSLDRGITMMNSVMHGGVALESVRSDDSCGRCMFPLMISTISAPKGLPLQLQ